MAKSISVDLRQRVCAAIDEGLSCREVAARFRVSSYSAIRWHALRLQTGSLVSQIQGGDRRSARIDAHAGFIIAQVETKSDITLAELKAQLGERVVLVAIGTLWRFFDRHRMTLKKMTAHAAEQQRDDVAAAREAWFEAQTDLDPVKLIFIDEIYSNTNMARS